jgi:hypothetical protein
VLRRYRKAEAHLALLIEDAEERRRRSVTLRRWIEMWHLVAGTADRWPAAWRAIVAHARR